MKAILILISIFSLQAFAIPRPAGQLKGVLADNLIAAMEATNAATKKAGAPGELLVGLHAISCALPDGSNPDDDSGIHCYTGCLEIAEGGKAEALIYTLRPVIEFVKANGTMGFFVRTIQCSTPDGSNLDSNFVSTCQVIQ